jgi:hypothetical protein
LEFIEMTYGIQCVNNSGELTLSSDGMMFGYIGKATLLSRSTWSGSTSTSQQGLLTYTINWPGPIMVAIGLKTSGSAGAAVQSVTPGTGTTWHISIIDATTTTEGPDTTSRYYVPATASDVYCWGLPTSVSGYGVGLYTAAGTLSADLSRRPLMFASRIALADSVMTATVPALIKPAIMGQPNSAHNLSTNTHSGGTPWYMTGYTGVWGLTSSTDLYRGDILTSAYHDDGGGIAHAYHGPTNALLIEANGLT